MNTGTYQALKEHIDQIWIVDTHEHLGPEEYWVNAPQGCLDFSHLLHYVDNDVVSAGMSPEDLNRVRQADVPLDEKWELFEPYWERAKNTSYCQAVERSIRELFGIEELSRETYKTLAQKLRERQHHGHYKWVLREKSRIAVSFIDTYRLDVDRELFVPVFRLEHFCLFGSRQQIRDYEKQHSVSISTLDDMLMEMGNQFNSAREAGVAAFKTAISYLRTLQFDNPSKEQAEQAFNRAFGSDDEADQADVKTVADFMFHWMVQLCVEHDVPLQIHTGLQAGNGNYLDHSNPLHLSNIFMAYPKGRFDLFHAGYPYWREVGVLAKMFPDVHLDLCWANIISPSATRAALSEWLETIPATKIFAFGGDYGCVECVYAHSQFARENVAEVLAEKVDRGYFTLDRAKWVAERLLRENAKEFFRLNL